MTSCALGSKIATSAGELTEMLVEDARLELPLLLPAMPLSRFLPGWAAKGEVEAAWLRGSIGEMLRTGEPGPMAEAARIAQAWCDPVSAVKLLSALDALDSKLARLRDPRSGSSLEELLLRAWSATAPVRSPQVRRDLLERLDRAAIFDRELAILSRFGSAEEIRKGLPALFARRAPEHAIEWLQEICRRDGECASALASASVEFSAQTLMTYGPWICESIPSGLRDAWLSRVREITGEDILGEETPGPVSAVAVDAPSASKPEAPREGPGLALQVLSPLRPGYAEIALALRGRSVAEALEVAAARGWINLEDCAVQDRRWLHLGPCEGCKTSDLAGARELCVDCKGTGRTRVARRVPASWEAVAAMASDPSGIKRAELLAQEAVTRFVNAHAALCGRRCEVVPRRPLWIEAVGGDFAIVKPFDWSRHFNEKRTWPRRTATPLGMLPGFGRFHDLDLAALKRVLEAQLQCDRDGFVGWESPDLPNPYAAVMDVWATGYVLIAARGTTLELMLPPA